MARRETILRCRCSHEGCREFATFQYDTQREARESYEAKHFYPNRWKCVRHAHPDEIMSADNAMLSKTMTVIQNDRGKYWDGQNGFTFGPGFKAYAADFPAGTQLTITAKVTQP